MGMKFGDRVANAWNSFMNPDSDFITSAVNVGRSSYRDPSAPEFSRTVENSVVSALYNRIGLDVAAIDIRHVRVDAKNNDQYLEDIDSELNMRLNLSANIDQTGRDFIQDLVLTMFDDGSAVIVPVDTSQDPSDTANYEILSLRVGQITEWYPDYVKAKVYNEIVGERQEIVVPKKDSAIVTNPLYAVMNEPNSTLKRLIHKLALLDVVDEQNSSGKLNMIIQLPYVIKSEARQIQAEQRLSNLENQLEHSKYGVAYADGTERITQLNRPLENNLLEQVKYLTEKLYNEMGISANILNGTASDVEMLNYYTRTIEPIVNAICSSMTRAFISKTAWKQGQRIKYFKDPFRLVPVKDLASIAQVFTSAEIMSSNEIRSVIPLKKSSDPNADKLRNANINPTPEDGGEESPPVDSEETDNEESPYPV